jgi:hypothetical protein
MCNEVCWGILQAIGWLIAAFVIFGLIALAIIAAVNHWWQRRQN